MTASAPLGHDKIETLSRKSTKTLTNETGHSDRSLTMSYAKSARIGSTELRNYF